MARRDTGNRTTYWQSKRIAGMSLLRADFVSHQFGPHTHDAFVIAVTEAGGAEISSRGITEKVGTETLFVSQGELELRCGALHCCRVNSEFPATSCRRLL